MEKERKKKKEKRKRERRVSLEKTPYYSLKEIDKNPAEEKKEKEKKRVVGGR